MTEETGLTAVEEEQRLERAGDEPRYFAVKPLENAVIQRATQGDEDAFEQVFMGTYRYVFATVRKYLQNEQDAYDAIQDTYTRVYKSISRLQSADSFYPWLHRIAENCAKDVLKYSESVLPMSPEEAEDAVQEDHSPRSDVIADVGEVLKLLPEEQRELLVRVYYDRMRVAEIARMQGVPATTLHNRLKAAKKRLKELLKTRGIDKPVYSGELVAMISTALRDAIGTELLSMAIAEEIMHNVTGSRNKKGAYVVSAFARKMRNSAARKIAALLLLACCLVVALAAFIAQIMTGGFYGGNPNISDNAGVSESTPSTDTQVPSSTTAATTSQTSAPVSEDAAPSAMTAKVTSTAAPSPEAAPLVLSESNEIFGTLAEDGYIGFAPTGDRIYAVTEPYLICAKKDDKQPERLLIRDFESLYGDSGCFLNVFEGRVYWINRNDTHFVLNRCELDGSGHYTKVFDEFDCTFLTDMLVARDGVYFLAGIHGRSDHTQSATLYRTDHDFKVQNALDNVADYALVGNTLYYLHGSGNSGILYSANRAAFDNRKNASPDRLSYGSLCAVDTLLILGQHNPYAPAANSAACLTVIDSKTGRIVRSVRGESGETIRVRDASPLDGGTVIYDYGDKTKVLNITSGKISDLNSPFGIVFGSHKYLKRGVSMYMADLYEDSAFFSFH